MNKFKELVEFIESLSHKDFQKYLIGILAGISILSLGGIYYIYQTSSSLKDDLIKLNKRTRKISQLIVQSERLNTEEQNVKTLLEAKKDFGMSKFFEQFYTKHKIKPEPNWKPEEGAVIIGSEEGTSYQEILLKATFKSQTMQKLVSILQDIYKEPIIYLKGLEISAEKSKINFEITLATKQYKKETVEV